jgi:NAD(P)-dependent dehydrogenase (short-subunit alcohol dehydrogenase family)
MRILITGAARGIGAESARRLAQRGHQLALLGLEPAELRAAAAACGARAFAIEADVRDRAALVSAVDESVSRLGGLDAVVANAGVASTGMVRSMDEDLWERVIDINLKGAYRTVAAALPHLIASRGYVLQVASVAALAHPPLMSAYSASKAGVEAFADALRAEVRHLGVDVGVAYFSWIDTDMVRGGDERPAFRHMRGAMKPPMSRTYPVDVAAKAVVRGVEKRARIVSGPRWVRGMVAAGSMVQPIADRMLRDEVPEIERIWDGEVAAHGTAASAPVGAGGAAART